jgi:hypothetical protein
LLPLLLPSLYRNARALCTPFSHPSTPCTLLRPRTRRALNTSAAGVVVARGTPPPVNDSSVPPPRSSSAPFARRPDARTLLLPCKPRCYSIIALSRRCRGEVLRRHCFLGVVCPALTLLPLPCTRRTLRTPSRPRRHAAEDTTTSPTSARDPVRLLPPHVISAAPLPSTSPS